MEQIYEVKEYNHLYKGEVLTRHKTLDGAEKHLHLCIELHKEIGITYREVDKGRWLGSNGKTLIIIAYGLFE